MARENDQHVSGYLREIRASVQDLQALLAEGNANAAGKTTAERESLYVAALADADLLRSQATVRVEDSLGKIRSLFATDPAMHDWCSDYVVRIEDTWKMAGAAWPAPGKSPDEVADAFRRVIARLDNIVFQCASLTVSQRINDVLENMRVGQSIRFQDEFAEELPLDPVLQAKILRELVSQDGAIEAGYLEEETGVIYRVSSTRAAQRWSVVHILASLFAGLGAAGLLCHVGTWANLTGWPLEPARTAATLANYTFLCVGAAAHLVIAAVTTARSRPNTKRSPWNDWILWLDAHETAVFYGILYVFLGFIFLTFTLKDLGWQTAFFAGYSIDSVIEVFLDRVNRLAQTQASALTKAIGGSPAKEAAAGA